MIYVIVSCVRSLVWLITLHQEYEAREKIYGSGSGAIILLVLALALALSPFFKKFNLEPLSLRVFLLQTTQRKIIVSITS